MSADRTRETMAAFLHDLSRRGPYGRHLAADVIFTTVDTNQVITGRAAVEGFIRHFHEGAFTTTTRTTMAFVGDGSMFLEVELVGTHTGTFSGIPATGRAIRVPVAIHFTIADGEITAICGHLDRTLLLEQIGYPPESPS